MAILGFIVLTLLALGATATTIFLMILSAAFYGTFSSKKEKVLCFVWTGGLNILVWWVWFINLPTITFGK